MIVTAFKISVPVTVAKFDRHAELKHTLLNQIRYASYSQINTVTDNIYRTDWNIPSNVKREYFETIKDSLQVYINNLHFKFGYKKVIIHNFWFQQYIINNNHNWHCHSGCNFSNIYFLELPCTNMSTEFIDPATDRVIRFDVEEGSIITFPSFLRHRSPVISTNSQKTVIVFNTSVE